MRSRLVSHIVIVTVLCLLRVGDAAASGEPRPRLRLTFFPEASQIVGGEDVVIYVRISNEGKEAWEAGMPHPEQYDLFPSELFEVRKDGQRLPLAKSPAVNAAFHPVTCLRAGDSLLLAVPLSRLAQVHGEDRFGRYQLRIHPDLYRGAYSPKPDATFEWMRMSPLAPPRSWHEDLTRPGWQTVELHASVDALLKLGADATAEPLPRVRAIARALSAAGPHDLPAGLTAWAATLDDVGGLALADALAGLPQGAKTLGILLLHKDLGVRRAAAGGLITKTLDYATFQSALERRERECDGVIRLKLELVIIRAAKDLPDSVLPPRFREPQKEQ